MFENVSNNMKKKSSQELASQIESVDSLNLENTKIDNGSDLDKKYEEMREDVLKLLDSGISDEKLQKKINKLSLKARSLGIDNEFAVELREERKYSENNIREYFTDFIKEHKIEKKELDGKIKGLKEKCYNLNQQELDVKVLKDFPGGNYLFHGTKVEKAISILDSGYIANTKKLKESNNLISQNSGHEGISWNFNEIGALPGDRYHLAGFLTSLEGILDEDLQLSIPSRPSPNELILINETIDSNRYYLSKTQQELLVSLTGNSVFGNISELVIYNDNKNREGEENFWDSSLLKNFAEKKITDEEMRKFLQRKYQVKENGTIDFSVDLLQQIKDEVPVGAVWLQMLIDTGRIKNIKGFEKVHTVREMTSRITEKNEGNIMKELFKDYDILINDIIEEDDKITVIGADISTMYFVVPDLDLRKWLRVIARCKTQPKGILIFDHKNVRLENFASSHTGDNKALSETLRKSIPTSEGFIDYESNVLGGEISEDMLVGRTRHIIGEQYLENRKSLKLDDAGKIKIE